MLNFIAAAGWLPWPRLSWSFFPLPPNRPPQMLISLIAAIRQVRSLGSPPAAIVRLDRAPTRGFWAHGKIIGHPRFKRVMLHSGDRQRRSAWRHFLEVGAGHWLRDDMVIGAMLRPAVIERMLDDVAATPAHGLIFGRDLYRLADAANGMNKPLAIEQLNGRGFGEVPRLGGKAAHRDIKAAFGAAGDNPVAQPAQRARIG